MAIDPGRMLDLWQKIDEKLDTLPERIARALRQGQAGAAPNEREELLSHEGPGGQARDLSGRFSKVHEKLEPIFSDQKQFDAKREWYSAAGALTGIPILSSIGQMMGNQDRFARAQKAVEDANAPEPPRPAPPAPQSPWPRKGQSGFPVHLEEDIPWTPEPNKPSAPSAPQSPVPPPPPAPPASATPVAPPAPPLPSWVSPVAKPPATPVPPHIPLTTDAARSLLDPHVKGHEASGKPTAADRAAMNRALAPPAPQFTPDDYKRMHELETAKELRRGNLSEPLNKELEGHQARYQKWVEAGAPEVPAEPAAPRSRLMEAAAARQAALGSSSAPEQASSVAAPAAPLRAESEAAPTDDKTRETLEGMKGVETSNKELKESVDNLNETLQRASSPGGSGRASVPSDDDPEIPGDENEAAARAFASTEGRRVARTVNAVENMGRQRL